MDTQTQSLTIKNLFGRDEVKIKFQEMLGKRSVPFITSVLQIVASNKSLANADPHSVYHSAAVAATLDLPLNNSLGFAYIVPYNESVQKKTVDGNGKEVVKWEKRQVAQFQLGYKGLKQLALRSGQFKGMNATDVREGEIVRRNRLTGEITFAWIEDENERRAKPIIGYVSYFELLNGYSQTFYMTVKDLEDHGLKYSQTFKNGFGLWKDDFHGMCLKTVTKLNLGKNAPLSIDMQKAITFDQAVINDSETEDVTYVDNTKELQNEISELDLRELYEEKRALLSDEEISDALRIIEGEEVNSYHKLHKLLTAK